MKKEGCFNCLYYVFGRCLHFVHGKKVKIYFKNHGYHCEGYKPKKPKYEKRKEKVTFI